MIIIPSSSGKFLAKIRPRRKRKVVVLVDSPSSLGLFLKVGPVTKVANRENQKIVPKYILMSINEKVKID